MTAGRSVETPNFGHFVAMESQRDFPIGRSAHTMECATLGEVEGGGGGRL